MYDSITDLATPATCSQSVCDSRRMVVAFMTALPAKGLGFSSPVDRALGMPEQIRSVHWQSYGSLNEHECRVDMGLGLVPFTIIDVRYSGGVLYPVAVYHGLLGGKRSEDSGRVG